MTRAGVGYQGLANWTQRVDEDGKGVSVQLIAFLATEKDYARETTRERTADLIEDALSVPRGLLFERTEMFAKLDPQPAWSDL
jgi:hypothetical protein